tara:strand:- start:288 stop:869 length:582 start_codon:yes stop_codon:yes gene_type:complete
MKRSILLSLTIFIGCATQTQFGNYINAEGSINATLYNYRVDVTEDNMDDVLRIRQVNNGSIPMQMIPEDFQFYALNLSFVDYKNKKDILALLPYRYGQNWQFITSLEIKIDGVKREWKWRPTSRDTDVIYGNKTQESATILLKRKDILELINANEIIGRMNGKEYYADIPIMKYIQSNWKSFYDKYLVDADID